MTLRADRFETPVSPVLTVSFPDNGLALITGTAVKDGDGWHDIVEGGDDLEIEINTNDLSIGIDPGRILGVNGSAYPVSFNIADGLVAVDSVTTERVTGFGVRPIAHLFAKNRSNLYRVGFQIWIRFK